MRKGKKSERFIIAIAIGVILVYVNTPLSCDSRDAGWKSSLSQLFCTEDKSATYDGKSDSAGLVDPAGIPQQQQSVSKASDRGFLDSVLGDVGRDEPDDRLGVGEDGEVVINMGAKEGEKDAPVHQDSDDSYTIPESTYANHLKVYSNVCLFNKKESNPVNGLLRVDAIREAREECPILPFLYKQPGEGHDCEPFPNKYTYDVPLLDPHMFHYKYKRFEGVIGHGTVKAFVLSTAYCNLPVIVARQIQQVGSYWAGAKKSLQARGYRHYPQIVSFCQTRAGAGEAMGLADFAYVYEEGLIHIKEVSKTIEEMTHLDSRTQWAAKLAVAIDYAHALAELHQEVAYPNFKNTSMVYCDHKPSNVMVTSNLEVILIDMDAMPTLSNMDENGEPKTKKVDCSIQDPTDIMRLMGEGFDLHEPINDKLDSWYMGEYLKRFILKNPPPSMAVEVKDMTKRLRGSYERRISAGEAYCQLVQWRDAGADLTDAQRNQVKEHWMSQWQKVMRENFVRETKEHPVLLTRLTPPDKKT